MITMFLDALFLRESHIISKRVDQLKDEGYNIIYCNFPEHYLIIINNASEPDDRRTYDINNLLDFFSKGINSKPVRIEIIDYDKTNVRLKIYKPKKKPVSSRKRLLTLKDFIGSRRNVFKFSVSN